MDKVPGLTPAAADSGYAARETGCIYLQSPWSAKVISQTPPLPLSFTGYALKMKNTKKSGFDPIVGKNPKVLILGTMPGEESLRKNQYYANPRNAFWAILSCLLKFNPDISYKERKNIIKKNHIAIWDVLMTCERERSLDSSINNAIINDFFSFYTIYPTLRYVFFNGAKAEKEYKKKVLPVVQEKHREIEYIRLPSTSPAMARLTIKEKIMHWSVILNKLNEA